LHHGGAVIDGPDLQKSDIGRVLLIGAGAVGASIAYLLPLLNLNFSDLCIINPDQVDYSNLNRVPLFFIEHIGVPKSEVVHNYLCAASVPSRYIGKWFNDVIGPELSLQNFDVVIPVANEHGVRAAVQANYPPVMIHGSTGSQWDAYAGRHIPLVDDCLVCRFPQPAAAPRCAQGVLKEQESAGAAPLTGALPFLSLAAGVLALADLVKLVIPGDPPNANTTILSFKSANLRPMIFDRVPRANCGGCPDPVVWQKLNGSSRHAPSSGAG